MRIPLIAYAIFSIGIAVSLSLVRFGFPIRSRELFDTLGIALTSLGIVLNSNFFTALMGALAGAGGATYFAARKERKNLIRNEIRATNAAITAAYNITDKCCAFKDEIGRPLCNLYAEEIQKFKEKKAVANDTTLHHDTEITAILNLESILPIWLPIDILKITMFEKISLSGRALTLVINLAHITEILNKALSQREHIIAEIRTKEMPYHEMANMYFGIKDGNSHLDTRYPDIINIIGSHTDDAIFCSKIIGDDLVEYGRSLAKAYGASPPKIRHWDFTGAENKGLIPDEKHYQMWTSLPQLTDCEY